MITAEDMHELAQRLEYRAHDCMDNDSSNRPAFHAIAVIANAIDDWARALAQKEDPHENP